jgi:hypothetical protein
MKLSKVVAATALLLLGAQVARAQVLGLPFYPTPTGMGVMASADYADPQDAGKVMVLRGGAGFGPFGATLVVGQSKVSGYDAQTMYGATVAMKVFGGGLLPVSVAAQAGFGQVKMDNSTITTIPVGAVVRANLPLFPLKPFAIGYYMLGSNVTNEVRASIGADFNLLLGLGVHAAYDTGKDTHTWGVGAHFNFRLPVL